MRNYIKNRLFYSDKMSESHTLVFDLAFNLLGFKFLPWLQLSLTCHQYHTKSFISRIFKIWKPYAMEKIINKLGKEFVDIAFSNGFSLMGSFVLDCIYDTDFCEDVDVIQDNKILYKNVRQNGKLNIKKKLKNQYLTNFAHIKCKKFGSHEDCCYLQRNKCDCIPGRSYYCQHKECNSQQWDAIEPFRHFINGDNFQYPPGYETDPNIFIVETYGITHRHKYPIVDFITITNDQTPRQFVSQNDYAFCRVLFDGSSLFISDLESIVNKKTSYTLNDAIRNYNRMTTNKLEINDPNLFEFIHNNERTQKYESRGFIINLNNDLVAINKPLILDNTEKLFDKSENDSEEGF